MLLWMHTDMIRARISLSRSGEVWNISILLMGSRTSATYLILRSRSAIIASCLLFLLEVGNKYVRNVKVWIELLHSCFPERLRQNERQSRRREWEGRQGPRPRLSVLCWVDAGSQFLDNAVRDWEVHFEFLFHLQFTGVRCVLTMEVTTVVSIQRT